jgi:glutamate-ammonia-ligase adenylyltransferase
LHTTYALLRQTYPEVADALRVLRQLVLERLVVLDCEQQAPLNTITQSMTTLAEFSLNMALEEALARVDQRHGPPMTAQGTRAQLWVVGMGKLGAGELNVSSDIDLVYVFDEDG